MNENICFFDLETTDKDIDISKICMIAIYKFNKESKEVIDIYKKYVNPTIPVSNEAFKVHGLSNTFLSNHLIFKTLAPGIKDFIENCDLGGYNIYSFDIPILQREFEEARIEIDLTDRLIFETFNIFKRDTPRTLSAAYQFYTGKEIKNAHDASADIEATIEVFKAQLDDHKDLSYEELASFSMFDKKTADPMNKFYYNNEGVLCFNFGKHKNKTIDLVEPSYIEWLLSVKDFPISSKNILKKNLK